MRKWFQTKLSFSSRMTLGALVLVIAAISLAVASPVIKLERFFEGPGNSLTIESEADRYYEILASTDLETWTSVAMVLGQDGLLEWTDENETTPRMFYRVVEREQSASADTDGDGLSDVYELLNASSGYTPLTPNFDNSGLVTQAVTLNPIGDIVPTVAPVVVPPVTNPVTEENGETATTPIPQPSAQSSGIGINILGIPTGNDASGSPEPNYSLNRSGPGIYLGFGQVVFDQVDMVIEGLDEVTNFVIGRRHLSQREQSNSIFGPSWGFNYAHTITRDSEDNVLMNSFGRVDLFTKVEDSVWEGGTGRFGRLVYEAGKYTLRMPHGTLLEFEADTISLEAHLTLITSPNGNTLNFIYEDEADQSDVLKRRLLVITDSFGRDIDFDYDDPDYPQGVSRIEDFSGREVVYDYNTSGRLLSVRSPTVNAGDEVRNHFPNGKTYAYEYFGSEAPELEGSLKAVIFPNEVADGSEDPRYQWDYERDNPPGNPYAGFVNLFALGDGTYNYSYRSIVPFDADADVNTPLREVTAIDREGTKTVYKTNVLGQVLTETVESRNLRPDEPASSYTKYFEYNSDGQLALVTSENGVNTAYLYANRRDLGEEGSQPNTGNPRNIEFPMTDVVVIPDSKRVADQPFIHKRTIFEPIYNKPYKIINPRGMEQTDGATSEALKDRFTTAFTYDYMESLDQAELAALFGISDSELSALLPPGLVSTGEVNGDGTSLQKAGNLVRIQHPEVTLPSHPKFDPLGVRDTAESTFRYNSFGQLIRSQDAEKNVTKHSYFGKSDPAGITSSDEVPAGGGYLRETVEDAEPVEGRNSGNEPNIVSRTTTYEYGIQSVSLDPGDAATNFPQNIRGVPTAIIDPRGIKAVNLVNELDQVIKSVRASDVEARSGAEIGLVEFAYEADAIYDHNDNVIESSIENEDTLVDGEDDRIVSLLSRNKLDLITQWVRDVNQAQSQNELAIETSFTYDRNENRTMILAGDEDTTDRDEYTINEYFYDERDILIQHSKGVGEEEEATFEQRIDAAGNTAIMVDGEDVDVDDGADGFLGGDATQIIYDGFNRKREVIDRVGNRSVYDHDSASNIVSIKKFGPIGESGSEELLSEITFTYDERNRIVRQDRSLFHYPNQSVGEVLDIDSEPDDGLVTNFTLYDGLGRLVASLDEELDLYQTHYDGLSRDITTIDPIGNRVEFAYDQNSNLIEAKEIELPGDVEFVTRQTFDALDRLVTSVEPNGQTTSFDYDSRDNRIRTTDALGNETERTYDRLDRLVKEEIYLSSDGLDASTDTKDLSQSGDGIITKSREYDDLNRIVKRIDDNLAEVNYTYDDLGRRIKCEYEDGSNETWEYSDDGEILRYKDRNGTVVTRTYDAKSRRLSERFEEDLDDQLVRSGTTIKTWSYDGYDRLIETTDNNGAGTEDDVVYRFTYDSLSRRIRESQRIGDLPELQVDIGWQGVTRAVELKYPNGRGITRSYDSLDRIIDIKEKTGNGLIAQFSYIGPGRTESASYGNGTNLFKEYDANRRAIKTRWSKDSTTITSYVNTYNNVNRRESENREHLGANNFDTYSFDSAYRMIRFRQDGSGLDLGGTLSFRSLDGTDMMTTFVDKGEDRSPLVSTNKLNQYNFFDGLPKTYDTNANLDDQNSNDAADVDDLEYIQDYNNRIVEVRNGDDSVVARYAYDTGGRRVLKTVDGNITRYLYDGWRVLEERSVADNGVIRQYVDGRGIDEHLQMRDYVSGSDPPKDYYYHNNSKGFVGAITDAAGAVVEYYEYDFLGQVTVLDNPDNPDASTPDVSISTVGNPYTFQGRRLDPETGSYYYRNRYYNAEIGQFLTIDPRGLWNHGQGNGASAFAEDPWNNSDPFGLVTKEEAKYVVYKSGLFGKMKKLGFFRSKLKDADKKVLKPLIKESEDFVKELKRESSGYKYLILTKDALDATAKVAKVGKYATFVSGAGAAATPVLQGVETGATIGAGFAEIGAGVKARKSRSRFGRHQALGNLHMFRGAQKIGGSVVNLAGVAEVTATFTVAENTIEMAQSFILDYVNALEKFHDTGQVTDSESDTGSGSYSYSHSYSHSESESDTDSANDSDNDSDNDTESDTESDVTSSTDSSDLSSDY